MAATILHADLDAFYASVEQLLDPSLRGKPIAVGGGVVLAASYEAKAFGIRGGMPGRRARELCPQLIFVDGHFKEYQRLGDAAIKVLNDFTPLVERISIDEAFADVAGCTHLFGPPAEIASAVRRRVRTELGLPISIGIARTKHLAKIASQVAKRLRASFRPGRTVTVRVRFAGLRSVTRSVTLDAPISATTILAEIAEELVCRVLADHPDEKTISLLAISVSHLETCWDFQLELPFGLEDEKRRPGITQGRARWSAARAMDMIRARSGCKAVGYGSLSLRVSRSVHHA